jgi:hypothetical protein
MFGESDGYSRRVDSGLRQNDGHSCCRLFPLARLLARTLFPLFPLAHPLRPLVR